MTAINLSFSSTRLQKGVREFEVLMLDMSGAPFLRNATRRQLRQPPPSAPNQNSNPSIAPTRQAGLWAARKAAPPFKYFPMAARRASERYLCQCATQPECLIGRRVACTREAFPQIANNLCLSVCLSRPRPSVCLAIRPARPDGIRVRIRNVYRWRRPRVSVQFLSDSLSGTGMAGRPNLDLRWRGGGIGGPPLPSHYQTVGRERLG